MVETTNELRPEQYRSFLLLLARGSLPKLGPAAHKQSVSDIVQDVLLKAHKNFSQFRGSTPAELRGWLRVIFENQLKDVARHYGAQGRDAALEASIHATVSGALHLIENLAANVTSPSQYPEQHERERRLADALESLPAEQRTAVELHHLLGYSVNEVAEKMNRARPSVAGFMRRGLAALREGLADLE